MDKLIYLFRKFFMFKFIYIYSNNFCFSSKFIYIIAGDHCC